MSRRSHGTTQSTPRANPPAPRARHAAVPTSPRACSVQQRAHVSARHPCGRRDPVSQGRAHLRRSALGWRSGTPRRRIFSQRCIQLRAAGMSCVPAAAAGERCARLGIAPAPPILRTSLRTAKNRRDRRPHRAAACARPWCTLCCTRIPAGMSKRRHGVHARWCGRAARASRFPVEWHLADRTHRITVLGRLDVLISWPAPRPSLF